jgi:hypothetical protein
MSEAQTYSQIEWNLIPGKPEEKAYGKGGKGGRSPPPKSGKVYFSHSIVSTPEDAIIKTR